MSQVPDSPKPRSRRISFRAITLRHIGSGISTVVVNSALTTKFCDRPVFSACAPSRHRAAFRAHGREPSTTLATRVLVESVGVKGLRRRHIRVKCRMPTKQESSKLKMSPAEPVFQTEIVHVDGDGVPVFFAITCFCGNRIELVMDL